MPEQEVEIIAFKATNHKPQQQLWALGVSDFPLPARFKTNLPPRLAQLGPGGWGGNHRHRRREVLVGLSEELWFIWKDADGKRHQVQMLEGDTLKLVVVAPWVPHMIENRGLAAAALCEMVDRFDGPADPLAGAESLRS